MHIKVSGENEVSAALAAREAYCNGHTDSYGWDV
jgi:hypothetical protein